MKRRSKAQRRRRSQRRRAKKLLQVTFKAWLPRLEKNFLEYKPAVKRLMEGDPMLRAFYACTDGEGERRKGLEKRLIGIARQSAASWNGPSVCSVRQVATVGASGETTAARAKDRRKK